MAHGTFCYCHGYRNRDPKMTVTDRTGGNARLAKLGNSAHTNSLFEAICTIYFETHEAVSTKRKNVVFFPL